MAAVASKEVLRQVRHALEEEFKGNTYMEDFILEYLTLRVVDAISPEEHSPPTIFDAAGDFFIEYEAARDEEDAKRVSERLEKALVLQRDFLAEQMKARVEASASTGAEGKLLLQPVRIGDLTNEYKALKERMTKRDLIPLLDTSTFKQKKKKVASSRARPIKTGDAGGESQDTAAPLISAAGVSVTSNSRNISIPSFSLLPVDGGEDLLSNASLKLAHLRRYGLIGRNGVGKTTLMKAIAKHVLPGIPSGMKISLVEQEISGGDLSVLQTVLSSDHELAELLEEEKRLSNPEESQQSDEANDERLREVHERLGEIDAWTAESRACSILAGLQFTDEMIRATKTKDLSGGWRMRVALASALFLQPQLLLLDEPTNHLDFPAVIWLEDYLVSYPGTIMVVSHDRFFINNVVTDIVHLFNKELHYYKGDYDTFEKTREEQLIQQKKKLEAQERKMAHVQKFIDRFRFNAKRATLVQSRIKTLNRLTNSPEFIQDVLEDPEFRVEFPKPERLEKFVSSVDDVSFGYSPDRILLNDVSVRVDMDSRIGILGKNGAGKSTLIRLLCGQLEPLSGYVQINRQARIALFAQHHVDQLDLSLSGEELILQKFPGTKSLEARSQLGRFGLSGDLAMRPMSKLSGGQKSRAAFTLATMSNPHLMILDEPTNHCDLETVEALLFAISVFEGGVVSVSHDQHFLMSFASEFWTVDEKQVKVFDSFEKAKKFTYSQIVTALK